MKYLILCVLLSSCASIPQTSLPPSMQQTIPNYTLSGSVNGTAFSGVAVIPWSSQYDVKVESSVDVDYMTISTCARDIPITSAISVYWTLPHNSIDYPYLPDPLENHGSCLMRIDAFNKKNPANNAFAILDFETPDATLPATNVCNGAVETTGGVSVCQSKAGLLQEIVFQTPVEIYKPAIAADCVPTTNDNLVWKLTVPLHDCVVYFQQIAKPHALHRADWFGWNQPVVP